MQRTAFMSTHDGCTTIAASRAGMARAPRVQLLPKRRYSAGVPTVTGRQILRRRRATSDGPAIGHIACERATPVCDSLWQRLWLLRYLMDFLFTMMQSSLDKRHGTVRGHCARRCAMR